MISRDDIEAFATTKEQQEWWSISVPRGSLEVFAGPMYAGKTTLLLQRVLWLDHQQKKILVIKPSKDNRYNEDTIVTHNQLSYPCISFTEFSEIEDNYNIMPYNYNTCLLYTSDAADDP